jgi:hypothetical protein
MKTQHIALLTALLCGSFAASASAATIIDSTTLNGSFVNSDSWTTGFNVEDIQIHGDQDAVIGQHTGDLARGVVQNTGYDVNLGDTFDLSFTWRSASNWDVNSVLHWTLFTSSDDTTAGTATVIGSGSITGTNSGDTVYNNSNTTYNTITGASDGKDLWIEFYGSKPSGTAYSRLDDVNLSVSVIPEPGSYALMAGLLGLTSVMLRRRK